MTVNELSGEIEALRSCSTMSSSSRRLCSVLLVDNMSQLYSWSSERDRGSETEDEIRDYVHSAIQHR